MICDLEFTTCDLEFSTLIMITKIKKFIEPQLKTELGDEAKVSSLPLAGTSEQSERSARKESKAFFEDARVPDIRPGDTVKVHQKIPASVKTTAGKKEKEKERIQVFEGLVIARKHGKEIGATITIRKVISGIGVEKIFPIHLPTIEKIEIVKRGKVRRAKLYYMRTAKGKRARLKQIDIPESNKISMKTELKETKGKIEDNTKLENPITEIKGEKKDVENKTKESTIKKEDNLVKEKN